MSGIRKFDGSQVARLLAAQTFSSDHPLLNNPDGLTGSVSSLREPFRGGSYRVEGGPENGGWKFEASLVGVGAPQLTMGGKSVALDAPHVGALLGALSEELAKVDENPSAARAEAKDVFLTAIDDLSWNIGVSQFE